MIPVTVTFYGDVGFDRSYNHVIDFSNETERESYFTPKILKTIQNCAYNKPMNSIQIRCNYEEALKFTYCKFIMGSNTSHQKKIFAWVDDVVLKTDQIDENGHYVPILEVNIAIDPWQTFLFDISLGESFVVREHVDRFSANGDGTKGWCLPNTTDNNSVGATKRVRSLIDFRGNYTANKVISEITKENYTEPPTTTSITTKVRWIAIQYVRKPTPMETEDGKNFMINLLVPVTEYPICFTRTKTIGNSTTTFYCRSLTEQEVVDDTYLTIMGIDPDRVASVVYIPFDIATLTKNGNYDETCNFSGNNIVSFINWEIVMSTFALPSIIACYVINFPTVIKYDYTINNSLDLTIPNNTTYSKSHEPQLYKSPFKQITLVDEFGIERGVFNDLVANTYKDNITPFTKFRIYLLFDSTEIRLRLVPYGLDLNSKYWIEYNLSNVEVIRNAWLSYMLQERDAARTMIQTEINQQAIASAIGGVASATSMGGQQAMGVGKAQAAGSSSGANLSEGGAFLAGGALGLGIGAIQTVGGYVANQHFMFEQQDIREKAIKNKANNISQTGNFKSIITEFALYETCCDETTLNLKALEFHKYGYSIYRYETPNIKTRKYFNFIATNIVKINGSLNNNIKIALMEIFNNGVTIWHGDYISELTGIGDYSKENIERSLL